MGTWQLAVTAGLALAASALLARVAYGIAHRPSPDALRAPRDAHALGWAMLATMVASDGLRVALALAGDPTNVVYITLIFVKIVATSTAFAAFGVYVLFIWTGSLAWWRLVVTLGTLHAMFFLLVTAAKMPFHVTVGTWATRIVLEGPGFQSLPQGVAILFFFVPTAAIAVAYLLLLGRLRDRTQRVRVVLVATAVVVFQLAGVVQSDPETDPDTLVIPAFTGLLLLAALVGLAAHYPPASVRRRWGVRGLDDETTAPEAGEAEASEVLPPRIRA